MSWAVVDICTVSHTNHTPPNVTYRNIGTSKGDVGSTGSVGAAGADSTVPGSTGTHGSLFLGAYANVGALPAIDGTSVRAGDYAYILDSGSFYVAS